MRVGLAVVALAALAATPASARVTTTVYVPAQNYPGDVRPGADQVTVRIRYELADNGTVARCDVQRSSGYPSLGAESCRILLERALIRPERRSRRGTLNFSWLAESSRAFGNERGGPLPFHGGISGDDYPLDAVHRNQSGVVRYEAEVSEHGRPLRCTVTHSSRVESLDQRTCEIVMTRSVFIPASDGAGGRRQGIYRGTITWRQP